MPELSAIARYNRQALRACGRGGLDQALVCLSNALRLAREAGRPLLEAFSKNNMGLVYQRAGRPVEAALCFQVALDLLRWSGPEGARRSLARTIEANLARARAEVALPRAA